MFTKREIHHLIKEFRLLTNYVSWNRTRMPKDITQPPTAGAHWLTNGQAITTVFVLVSTVCLYPSNMALGGDGSFAIMVHLPQAACSVDRWSDQFGLSLRHHPHIHVV